MNNLELAKIKFNRAVKIAENYDEMTEENMRTFFLYLLRTLDNIPQQTPNKLYWHAKVNGFLNMDLKKYGSIFKAVSWKDSIIIKKQNT